MKLKVRGLENAVDRLVIHEKAITTNADEIREEIHSFANRLIGIIEQAKTDLTTRVNKVTQQKLNALALQKNETDAILEKATESLDEIEEALSKNTPEEFLTDMKHLLELAEATNHINTTAYQPVEEADIKLRGNGALLVYCKTLGTVVSTSVHSFCKPTCIKKAQVGINASFDFEIRNHEGVPISLSQTLIRCDLIPPGHEPVPCPVSSSVPGVYRAKYTPLEEGLHHMKIVICGEEIPNSPFAIPVSSSPNHANKKAVFKVSGLQRPWGVSINQQYIVVAEASSHRLTLLDREGERVRTIGSKGKEDGRFTEPRGVVITANNNILVTDYDRIQKVSMTGQCLRVVCGKGTGPLQFNSPRGLAVHPTTGKVYIADCNNHRIQVLHPDLSFSHSFGRQGNGEGEFQFPWDVSCDEEGFVYVVDNENHIVHKYTPEGEFVMKFGGKGTLPGQLNWPSSMAIANRKFYITDDNNRVSVFDYDGQFVELLANEKDSLSPFALKHPLGIVVDESGRIHISDCWNNRLLIL